MKYEAVFDIPDEIITNKEKLYCGAVVYEGEFNSETEIISYEQVKLNPKDRSHGKWEYLKEHITELRDANGYATQYGTCQFILNLMGVIEREGDENE